MSDRKIGAGHAAAMGRLGLRELRNAAVLSRESVADSELGLYGSLTQGEIADARGGPGHGSQQESVKKTLSLDDLREEAAKRGRDDRGKDDRDRGDDRGQERGGMER
ncbi:MAG TPA: hypothetical protein VE988_19785 [Gemmataceae bacterium]|nr:hypothetical protein [Gemmataceae bacterium]